MVYLYTMIPGMKPDSSIRYRFIFLSVLSLLLLVPSMPSAADDAPNPPVILQVLLFESDKRTRPAALAREVKLKEGMTFASIQELTRRLDREVQDLVNLRIFANVDYRIENLQTENGEPAAVRVVISVQDTWTFIPFIAPQSDGSTTAIQLAIVDKNFLGSMTEFKVSGAIGVGTDPLSDKIEIPQWGVYVDWKGYTVDQWQFSTRLSQTYETERKFDGSTMIEEISFYQTLLLAEARYEFPKVPRLYLYMIPQIGWRYSYDVTVETNPIEYEYFRSGLTLGLDYDHLDWIEFYRRGWSLGFANSTWGSTDRGDGSAKSVFIARSSGFATIWGINPNARLLGTFSLNHEMSGLGFELRGVKDDIMYGDRAIFLNTGVQIRLWKAKVVEPHLQPFIDIGLAGQKDDSIDWADFHVGMGTELILFLPKAPSVQIRCWLGFDVTETQWSDASWEAGLSFKIAY